MKSGEKRLITKEHIATHTHLNFNGFIFKHSSNNIFNSNTKFDDKNKLTRMTIPGPL